MAPQNNIGNINSKHWLDYVQFFVVSIGVVAAGLAAWFTHEQVGVAKDSENRQLRAYVSIEPGETSLGKLGNIKSPDLTVLGVALKNNGSTPAYGLRMTYVLRVLKFPLPRDYFFSSEGSVLTDPQVLFQDNLANFTIQSEPITDGDANSIVNEEGTKLVFYGTVFYSDAFNKQHHTNFCSTLGGEFLKKYIKSIKAGENGLGATWFNCGMHGEAE